MPFPDELAWDEASRFELAQFRLGTDTGAPWRPHPFPTEPSVTRIWEGLLTGEYALRELGDREKRRELVVDHVWSERPSAQALTRPEFVALMYRAQAFPLKVIAGICHCSEATTSVTIRNASDKLRLLSSTELAGLFGVGPRTAVAQAGTGMFEVQLSTPSFTRWRVFRAEPKTYVLSFPRPAAFTIPDGLSASQCEVTRLLLSGMDTRQIATARNRSRNTVANQVASIYRGLGVNNRLELALVCRGLMPPSA